MSKRRLLLPIPLNRKIIRRSSQQARENTRPERFAVAPVARERHHRQALLQIARGESEDQAALGFGGFGGFLGSGGAGFELGLNKTLSTVTMVCSVLGTVAYWAWLMVGK